MNKKIIVVCSILALILLGGIGYGFYKLTQSDAEQSVVTINKGKDPLNVIPSDAIVVYRFDSFESLYNTYFSSDSHFSHFINKSASIVDFIERFSYELRDIVEHNGVVLSLHYPLKNSVSALVVLSIDDEHQMGRLKEAIDRGCSGVINKRYSGQTISKSTVPEVSYSFCGKFLMVSASHITVESAVRHLESGTSILDNSQFASLVKESKGGNALYINHRNLGKLFSGAVQYPYLRFAPFFSSFSSWSSYRIDASSGAIVGEGTLLNYRDVADFSSVFTLQRNRASKLYDILPHNTQSLFSIPIYSAKGYLSSYIAYLEANKKINDYRYINSVVENSANYKISPEEWFISLGVEELGVATIPSNRGYEKIVLLKVSNPSVVTLYPGYLSAVLGKFFHPSEESFVEVDGWIVIGRKETVEKLAYQADGDNYLSFRKFIEQTPTAHLLKRESSLLGVVNLSRLSDSLSNFIKDRYSSHIKKGINDYTFNLLAYSVTTKGGKLIPTIELYADNVTPVYTTPVKEEGVVVDIPKGPFVVKNFITKKDNRLHQLDDFKLRMVDEKNKGVWTIPFDSPICGYVGQVDYFRNNKLQMVFCAGSKLYMLDRLGRWVKPFPIDLKKGVLLGPKVYDFSGDKKYSIMVLHEDNEIAIYTIDGKPSPSWSSIILPEKVKQMPELLVVGGKRYWIIKTNYQTVIANEDGQLVADFSKKRRIASDSGVEVKSSNEVEVKMVDGKKMVLNLQSGTFKKI